MRREAELIAWLWRWFISYLGCDVNNHGLVAKESILVWFVY